ncbi:MAG: N-acetyl-gamma-glutamyl-phosphate reductase [Candidatus Kapabacteria bacterium]|nr:N-acetyl-gamma-glutamyl-phosphate reductase [Candidatus Kapabacteria bacterium]
MIRAAIIGAAGYTGGELLRLLRYHPHVGEQHIVAVSTSHAGKHVSHAHPDLVDSSVVFVSEFAAADVVFLCVGHGKAAAWLAEHPLPVSTRVIDLSMDHRLDPAWMYGLPEANRSDIASATRVANPGCFATTIELALLPLRGMLEGNVYVTALTGSTGAGQAPSDTTHYSWRANNVSVYKAFDHQHLPEIAATVGYQNIVFVPMRGSWTRGILASTVVTLANPIDGLRARFNEVYADHPFTHVVEDLPDVKRVVGTNNCCIGMQQQGDQVLIVSVIDNLLKGASGQAVQNMNIMFGLDETSGLHLHPVAY